MKTQIRYFSHSSVCLPLAMMLVLLLQLFLVTPALALTDPARWMGELAEDPQYAGGPSPMNQTLSQFIFPGSHDAGTYSINDVPACDSCRQPPLKSITDTPSLGALIGLISSPFAEAQDTNILGQLTRGSRFFDLRFFRANADDVARSIGLTTLTEGKFYIHHTYTGPSSDSIFAQIRDFLSAPDREREIIILNFSAMNEGAGPMPAASAKVLLKELFTTIGQSVGPTFPADHPFAPASLGDMASIQSIYDLNRQIIVVYQGNVPGWNLNDPLEKLISESLWNPVKGYYFGSNEVYSPGGYPPANLWNTEAKLFSRLEELGKQRSHCSIKNVIDNKTRACTDNNDCNFPTEGVCLLNKDKMFRMNVNMGPDNKDFEGVFPRMFATGLICNYHSLDVIVLEALRSYLVDLGIPLPAWFVTLFDYVTTGAGDLAFDILLDDVAGLCTAIADDWDRFLSLDEVASWTNSKVLPALIGLPRDHVNIVLTDNYPVAFTQEAMKLNRGAARVTVVVDEVRELEPHFPDFLTFSSPDYYPRITFVGDEWPVWGGDWLEISNSSRISPNWTAMRAVAPSASQVTVKLQMTDQNNRPVPDTDSWINGYNTVYQTSADVWLNGAVKSSSSSRNYIRGPTTGCTFGSFPSFPSCDLVFDSSSVIYSVGVCQWAPPPGGVAMDATSCDFDWTSLNTPPVAVLDISLISYPSRPDGFLYEGQEARVIASDSYDPDAAVDPVFLGRIAKYEYDCEYDPAPTCLNNTSPDDFVAAVGSVCNDGYSLVPDGFVPGRGCRNQGENWRGGNMWFNPSDGYGGDDIAATGKQLTMALRVTDTLGLSDIATQSYPVINLTPTITRFDVIQEPGTTTVTTLVEFTDNGENDEMFQCRFFFNDTQLPAVVTEGQLDDPTVVVVRDPDNGWLRTFYTCSVTRNNLAPGSYRVTAEIEDKDFAKSAFVPFQPFEVINHTVSDLTDGAAAGSLRNQINLAPAGSTITFDPALSGQTIMLTGGELIINKKLTIDASTLPGGLTISSNYSSRIFNVPSSGDLVLKGVTISSGSADYGGAIRVTQGTLTMEDSTLLANYASQQGGALYNQDGTINLNRVTLSANLAVSVAGAIFNYQATMPASLNLTNSTVTGNSAYWNGGAILNQYGTINLVHTTISKNNTNNNPASFGGGIDNAGGALNIENSIVADNTGPASGNGPDIGNRIGGIISPTGANLIGNNDTVSVQFPDTDPLVGTLAGPLRPLLNPLGNNGGPTQTMLPVAVSPVIGAAITRISSPAIDQRHLARLVGASDIGAVERQGGDIDPDADGDFVPDLLDNCLEVSNSNQRDTDGDGYGNVCDPDFDNNLIVNAADLGYLKSKFFTTDPHADLDGSGVVNAGDLARLKSFFFKAPGPSSLNP